VGGEMMEKNAKGVPGVGKPCHVLEILSIVGDGLFSRRTQSFIF